MDKQFLNIVQDDSTAVNRDCGILFDALFHLHYNPLLLFATKLVTSKQIAEDIVMIAFTKLWNKRAEIEKPEAVKSYLYTSVRNACIDKLRGEKRKRKNEKVIPIQQEWEEPVLRQIIKAETLHEIYTAGKSLPKECGKVFRLFYIEGKDYATIAKELKLSINTVRFQKRRALQIIRGKILLLLLFFFLF